MVRWLSFKKRGRVLSKRKRLAAIAVAGVLAAGAMTLISGCSTATPAVSQCAVVTGHGFGSGSQNVVDVLHPGARLRIGNGNIAWYYPCDARNFIISPDGQPGDVHTPVSVRTAPKGNTPGMPVNVWLGVYFTPNQNDAVMKQFLGFCLKYGCAESSAQDTSDIQNNPHFSTQGWEGMLQENFPFALQRAATDVISKFDPTLWVDPSLWPKLGDDIAAQLNAELAPETQTQTPYFCGSASTESTCTQMTVVVNKVEPVDQAVVQIYNQQIAAENSIAANTDRLNAARELYGSYAPYFLGVQDTISQCQKVSGCSIYIGNPGTIPAGK